MIEKQNDNSAAELEFQIAKQILTPREKRLMTLLFEPSGACSSQFPETLKTLTDHYDIDYANINYSLMLAVLGFWRGWEHFPKSVVPRLKGIHRYCQAKNVMGMPWLLEKIRLITSRGIPVMFIKGLAMRFHYAPNIPRIMNDYDIAVPRDRFAEVMELLHDGKVTDKGTSLWSDTVIGRCSGNDIELDVHQWIFKEQGDEGSGIWKRAIPVRVQDVEVLVPSPEDMLIHQLNTQANNLFVRELPENRMKWLFDCRMIWQNAGKFLDPDLIVARASEFHTEYSSRLMLILYAFCLDDQRAIEIATRIQPITKPYIKWIKAGMAFGRHMDKMRTYQYAPYGSLDLLRVMRAIKTSYMEYQIYRAWPRGLESFNSFVQFCLRKRRITNWDDFRRQYFHRLPKNWLHFFTGNRSAGA